MSEEADFPLVDLAARTASHFFHEKTVRGFSERVLDELIADVGAGSGALILFRDPGTTGEVVAARNESGESIEHDPRVSRTILRKIREGLDSVLIEDAQIDELLARQESAQKLSLRSVLAIPLRFRDYLAGAIYLENRRLKGAFVDAHRERLLALGRHVAIFLDAALKLEDEIRARKRLYRELKGKTYFDGLIGHSPRMVEVVSRIEQVASSTATVLIEGESGTGKELVARALHRASDRKSKPLVVVNCAALPEDLLEAELFGTEPGAFTGAVQRAGRCEMAHEGTLFLDEIGELPKTLQVKFLRFLQEHSFERLGGKGTRRVDVRVVAATNRNLREMVARGEFREELYYRLWVFPIELPALRERKEDIQPLAEHFFRVFSLEMKKEPPEVEPAVFECFRDYGWPGNIRQLENVVQRLVVETRTGSVTLDDLPEELSGARRARKVLNFAEDPLPRLVAEVPRDYEHLKRRRQELAELAASYALELENRFVDKILDRASGNISRAAKESGMHRTLIHKNLRSRRSTGGDPSESRDPDDARDAGVGGEGEDSEPL